MSDPKRPIRDPAVSGTFYPDQAETLTALVDQLLEEAASRLEPDRRLRALVCPHAGYEFSGRIAAEAFSCLKGRDLSTVVLVGPDEDVTVRRKEKSAGIWHNGEARTFTRVPSFYSMAMNRQLSELATQDLLDQLQIGIKRDTKLQFHDHPIAAVVRQAFEFSIGNRVELATMVADSH